MMGTFQRVFQLSDALMQRVAALDDAKTVRFRQVQVTIDSLERRFNSFGHLGKRFQIKRVGTLP